MSVLRTRNAVKLPSSLSSLSSSQSIKIPLRLNFPKAGNKNILLLLNGTTRNLTRTGLSIHRVRMADSSSVDPSYCEIIVVRHGETAWNVEGKIQGHLDVELNEVGRGQAVAVADRLAKEFQISVVYSSDLKRALETAQTIAKSCGGLQVIEDPDLRERHLGELQGLIYREAAKTCPDAYKALLSHKLDQEIPGGGESLDQLHKRCTSALQRIGRKHKGERVVVVTHGGAIRALYKRACPNRVPAGKVLNTSVSIFQLSDGNKWFLKSCGDVSHLNQTGFLKSGFGGDRTSG